MWVKICGTTSLEDAEIAVAAGADALGFVFAESSRQMTPGAVRAITQRLPENIARFGVFVDPGFEEVLATVEEAGLTGAQLHTARDPGLAQRLRAQWSAQAGRAYVQLLRVLHYSAGALADELAVLRDDRSVDAVLIDSRAGRLVGGTGVRFNWREASGAMPVPGNGPRVIVAGGLTPENVGEAVATLRPWGVDVVTGVEASPGRKDAARVRAFVAAARAAASALVPQGG